MIDDKKTVVITYIDNNFEENLEKDFLHTLRNVALYKGMVILLDYGISNNMKNKIREKYNVKIYTFEKTMPVFTLRNRDIPNVIESLPEEITNVMVIDGGDVWFQKSINQIFEITKDKIGFVTEPMVPEVKAWLSECQCNLRSIDSTKDFEITDDNFKNSGMVCGPKEDILKITKAVFTDTINAGKEFFGIDQLLFNYEVNKYEKNKLVYLNDEFNYVLITHKNEFTLKDGQVFDKDFKLVTVVHNAGGNLRVLDKQYNRKNIDVSIYISKNIRPIKL